MGYVENNSNQLFNYYREADVFILPSFSEGSPLCIIEAFACKTLVIGSKVGGIPELLENNRGILLNEIEAKEISQKIESVYEKFLTDSTCINTVLDNSFQWAYHKTRIKERKKMYGMTFND
jgi:glycosyltransferase involved in cell wall biosynthesis